jgi:hypothetical protein
VKCTPERLLQKKLWRENNKAHLHDYYVANKAHIQANARARAAKSKSSVENRAERESPTGRPSPPSEHSTVTDSQSSSVTEGIGCALPSVPLVDKPSVAGREIEPPNQPPVEQIVESVGVAPIGFDKKHEELLALGFGKYQSKSVKPASVAPPRKLCPKCGVAECLPQSESCLSCYIKFKRGTKRNRKCAHGVDYDDDSVTCQRCGTDDGTDDERSPEEE